MSRTGGLGAVALIALGCQCEKDRPYTPFHIEPGAVRSSSDAAPSATAPVPSFSARPFVAAPKDVSDWTLEGVALGVDKSRVVERALVADFDGDGKSDGVAWTRARTEPLDLASSGELVFFSTRAPAGRVVAKVPGFVPSGQGCHHTVAITQTGKLTVTLDVSARCDSPLLPRSPSRALVVVAPAAAPPIRLALRVADPAPGELTSFAVDSLDRDGDGRDDVRLVASTSVLLEEPRATMALVWVDRAAGLARDASEPKASLLELVSKETLKADGKNAPRLTPVRVANARRLFGSVCAESGTPRVFDADGQPLPCGDIGSAMIELTAADVRAAVQRKDALGAVAALGRDGWYGAVLPEKSRAFLEKDVLALAPARAVREIALAPQPKAKPGLPRWSPLAFESPTSVLLETAEDLFRVTLPDLATTHAEDVEAWPVTVGGDGESRWMGISFPCDRSEILLMGSTPEGNPLPPTPTPLVGPRPGPCGHGPVPTPSLVPLKWTASGHVGLVGGALFGADSVSKIGAGAPRGSPLSTDGKTLVYPWSRGILVISGSRGETWTADAPEALSDCVVTDGALAAACVRGNRAVVFIPEAPTKPAAK